MRADAEVVVDPADEAEPDDQRDEGPARGRERDALAPDVREEIPDHGREDDGDTTHRRRSGLGDVGVLDRTVVADLLADAAVAQRADEQWREEHGEDEGRARGHEHGDHGRAPPEIRFAASASGTAASTSARATRSRPRARLAFTRTASPARTVDDHDLGRLPMRRPPCARRCRPRRRPRRSPRRPLRRRRADRGRAGTPAPPPPGATHRGGHPARACRRAPRSAGRRARAEGARTRRSAASTDAGFAL